MSQDQFDKWLKDSIDNLEPNLDLNQEWKGLTERLNEDRRRRRMLLWWWLSGSFAIILTILLFGWGADLTTDVVPEVDLSQQKIDVPVAHQEGHQQSAIEGDAESETEPVKSLIESGDRTGQPSVKKDENGETPVISEIAMITEDVAAFGTDEKEVKPGSGASMITIGREEASEEEMITPEARIQIFLTSLPMQKTELEPEFPELTSPVHPLKGPMGAWSAELSIIAGTFLNEYTTIKGDRSATDSYSSVESPGEVLGGEIMINYDLGRGWQLGAGLGMIFRHMTYAQDFTDTLRGTSSSQVIRSLEDFDGNVTNIYGSGDGQYVYEVSRRNHQIFYTASMPVQVRKIFPLNRKLSMSIKVGLVPGISLSERGRSVISNENDIALITLEDRYNSNFTMDLRGGYDISWNMEGGFEVFGGFILNYQALGRKGMDDSWSQQMHNAMWQFGMRKRI